MPPRVPVGQALLSLLLRRSQPLHSHVALVRCHRCARPPSSSSHTHSPEEVSFSAPSKESRRVLSVLSPGCWL